MEKPLAKDYFEASAVITVLVIVGQALELARAGKDPLIRAAVTVRANFHRTRFLASERERDRGGSKGCRRTTISRS
jgi:hypothetical protein